MASIARLSAAERRFVQRFRQGWMRVDGTLQILRAALELHRQRGFGDELARHGSDDVDAQDAVGLAMRQQLDEPARRLERSGAAIGAEGKQAALVGKATGLELLLGLAHPGDLRCGVDHRGNHIVVDVGVATRDAVCDRNALLLALVREHRAAHAIADRADVLAPVRQSSSTRMKPRSSSATPLSADSSSPTLGRRPMATITRSTDTDCAPPAP